MESLQQYKRIIKWVFWTTIVLIIFLTIQAIYETDNWKAFAIDYNTRDHIISAYGTLIGGVLAFLSILFVLYQVYEQREQIIREREEVSEDKRQDLKDRLMLLTNYLLTLKNDIIKHGERMEVFYKKEKENPSFTNSIYFNTNKNFERVIEMDILSNFKAFQLYFNDEGNDWQRQFINLYEIADFYNEAFKDLKKKYELHTTDKVKTLKLIAKDMGDMLNAIAKLVDDYRTKYGAEDYLTKPWSILVNEYTPAHYVYLQEVQNNGEVPDYRHISNELLMPLISSAMEIRNDIGYDDMGSRDIIEMASNIRKRIWEVETYSLQYADDIEKQYTNYFSADNESYTRLSEIKTLIDEKLETI